MNKERIDPVGGVVKSFEVRGQEVDGHNRWVGADLMVCVQPLGRYLLRIVTKDQFGMEQIQDAQLPEADNIVEMLEAYNEEDDKPESRPPFVLNDSEITEDVLVKKFTDRQVEPDLAASLFFESS